MGLVCMQLPCALCGGPFEINSGDPVFVAYDDAGSLVGETCPRCFFAGEEGLERRMMSRAKRLKERAGRLERLAGEGIRLPLSRERRERGGAVPRTDAPLDALRAVHPTLPGDGEKGGSP